MTIEYIKNSDNIDSYEAQLDALKEEVLEDEKRKKNVYSSLNLGYNPGDISRMRDKMLSIFNRNSLEGILFNNIQIQNLFSTILGEQEKDWIKKNNEYDAEKADESDIEEQEEISIGWEEYSIRESSPENFEQFLLSEEGITTLKKEINDHIDPNGNIYKNYPISKKSLQLKLRKAWFNSLRRRYNEYYGDFMDSDEINIKRYENIISNSIDEAVGNHLKEGGDKYGTGLVKRLEKLLISEDGNNILLDMKEDSVDMDNFRVYLKESIRKYANIILKRTDGKNVQLSTGETQLDLQLKSYLFIYGKFFYPDDFKNGGELTNYNETLLDLFEAILNFDGKLETVKNNKYLELERMAELARLERDKQRRIEIARRNRERNEYRKAQTINRDFKPAELQTKYVDPNHATGPEIAASAGLGEDLDDYNLNIKESKKEKQQAKEVVFRNAWNEFIQKNDSIKAFITQEQMRKLFDVNSKTIREGGKHAVGEISWEEFEKNNPLFKEMSPEDIKKIRGTIYSFSRYFDDADKKLSNTSSEVKQQINETVRTYAIGAVIDNVRDTFESIPKGQDPKSEGFKLDMENPVIRIHDYIVISGSFNGSNVKIRYNLKTGELFMNSFLHKDEIDPNKISIGDISSIEHPELINHPIGKIKPFSDVLNDYYKLPLRSQTNYNTGNRRNPGENHGKQSTDDSKFSNDKTQYGNDLPGNNPLHAIQTGKATGPQPRISQSNPDYRKQETERILSSQINLIGDAMEKHIKCQTLKNLAITNFMKSFNVISDGKYNSRDFNRGSNLFSIIEIIDNTYNIDSDNKDNSNDSDGLQSLEYFNNEFMPKIMEYSGLIWGQKNESQDKKGKKSERIFSYEGDNNNIKLLRDKVKNFNPEQFSGADFNGSHQLEFVELIKEKVTKETEPNRKLDIHLMKDFLKSLDAESDKE